MSSAERPGLAMLRRPNLVPVTLAWASLRHRRGGWLLLALGMALASCLPVISVGLQTESSAAAVLAAVDALAPAQRTVFAVTAQRLDRTRLRRVNQSVRDEFAAVGLPKSQQLLIFRPLALAGTDVTLGAVDGLASAVRLSRGRLPRRCRPTACEALALTQPGTRPLDLPALSRGSRALGLLITGVGELLDRRPVGVGLVPADLPVILGADPGAMGELSSLTLFGRNSAWISSLDGATVVAQGAATFSRGLVEATARLNVVSGQMSLGWPDQPVASAARRAAASTEKFPVLGAGAAALQLGFCLVAASGMRRRVQLARELLNRRGGSPIQLLLVPALQSAAAVVTGLFTGAAAGAVVVGLRDSSLLPRHWTGAFAAVGHAWPVLAGVGVAAVVSTVAVVSWPAAMVRSTRLVIDVLTVAVVAATVLVLRTAGGGSAAASVVVGVAAATGLLAARLWPPLLGLLTQRDVGPLRLVALVGARRRPLLTTVSVGFLAAAVSSVVQASCYHATMGQSAADQAASQVPLDVRIAPGPQASVPLDARTVRQLLAVSPAVAVHPVVSAPVTAFAGSSSASALPLTGIDLAVVPELHEFAATTGTAVAPAELARRLAVPASRSGAPTVPPGAVAVTVPVRGVTPDVTLSLWLTTADGRTDRVALVGPGPLLTADVHGFPRAAVAAIEIGESGAHLMHRTHGIGEGGTDRPLAGGQLVLGTAKADGRPLGWSWQSWGSDQAKVISATSASLMVRYQVGQDRVLLTPRFPAAGAVAALPVAADPDTAARAGPDGDLGATVNGTTLPARIVAVLPRMPTLGPSFLVADRSAVISLVNRTAPGTAPVSQLWVAAPSSTLSEVRRVLSGPGASSTSVSYRADLAQTARTDPVATRFLVLLVASALVALLLALVGVAMAIRADGEQSAAEQFALELDGWPPRRIRRLLLLRWLAALAVALPIGVAGGLVLAAVSVRTLLPLGDGAAGVAPPPRLVVVTPGSVLVLAALLASAGLTCWLTTVASMRSSGSRPELDLR